jgi:hypothetical protein
MSFELLIGRRLRCEPWRHVNAGQLAAARTPKANPYKAMVIVRSNHRASVPSEPMLEAVKHAQSNGR